MTEILNISDGTTTISLLDNTSIKIIEWIPAISVPDTTLKTSVLSDFQPPTARVYKNTVETFRLYIVGTSQDNVISKLSSLINLLEQAAAYHISEGVRGAATYITARSGSETNTRYALIYNYRIETIPQVHQESPFTTGALSDGVSYSSAFEEIVLVIERAHWLSSAPGNSTAIQLSSTSVFNSATYGQEATTGKVFVSNSHHVANISHIYSFDASAGTYSSNLAASTSFTMFPSSPAANDAMYFGCQSSITNSGPFHNLVFDIGTAKAGTNTLAWEYWNGSTWTSITITDGTDSGGGTFTATGVNVISLRNMTSWTANAVNSVTAYWVRARISAFTTMTRPTQQNRRVYTQTASKISIDSGQLGGNLPSLTKIDIYSWGGTAANSIYLAARSTSRGADFSPFLFFSDSQNPPGVTLSAMDITVVSGITVASGKYATLDSTSSTEVELCRFTLDNTIASQYSGRFKLFLVGNVGTDGLFRAEFHAYDPYTTEMSILDGTSYHMTPTGTLDSSPVDLGTVNLSPRSGSINSIVIRVYAKNTTASSPIYSLVLLPIDEMFIVSSAIGGTGITLASYKAYGLRLHIDSTIEGKSRVYISDGTYTVTPWLLKSGETPSILHNASHNLWFFADTPSINVYQIAVSTNKRYLSLRGAT